MEGGEGGRRGREEREGGGIEGEEVETLTEEQRMETKTDKETRGD